MTAAKVKETVPTTTFAERRKIATAPAWRPESGDALENVEVIALELMTGGEFGDYPKVTYKLPDGSYIAFHAFHSLAKENLAELRTEVGKFQNIAYEGERISNSRKDSNGDPQRYELYYIENVGEVKETKTFKFDQPAY